MRVKAHAKINICLDVLKKEKEYHRISTVFHEIELHDLITLKEISGGKITVECGTPRVPADYRNTAYKAAKLMLNQARAKNKASNDTGLLISITKNIPVASGLGGAASDAAAVMKALNTMWKLKISKARLRSLAAEIGMDVPFFIEGGTALGTHYGEKIKTLPNWKTPPLLIVMNGSKKSTRSAYAMLDHKRTGRKKDLTALTVAALKSNNGRSIRNLAHNDFETILCLGKMPETKQAIRGLLCSGADVVHICGSGPAVYAMYGNRRELEKAYAFIKKKAGFLYKNV